MKVLTLIQPWATLIALGEKRIETRSWKTSYRGPLLIHAGKKVITEICLQEPFKTVLESHGYKFPKSVSKDKIINNLPKGLIIAKCNLVDCVQMTD